MSEVAVGLYRLHLARGGSRLTWPLGFLWIEVERVKTYTKLVFLLICCHYLVRGYKHCAAQDERYGFYLG